MPKKTVKRGSWIDCVSKAKKELKVKGFQPVKKGTPLYKLEKQYHEESKKIKNKK